MNYLIGHTHHLEELENIVKKTGEIMEGGCFYYHQTFNTDRTFAPKHENIMDVVRGRNNIVEIGFNAGHSCLLMLVANPNCYINVFDICSHKYTKECFNYLNSQFNNRMTLYEGNSHTTLSEFISKNPSYRFDVIHIDGNHEYTHANIDYFLSKQMSQPGSYCIFDDTNIYYLNELWNGYIQDRHLTEIFLRDTGKHRHSIGIFL